MAFALGDIPAPVLMLHGTKDLAVPIGYARNASELLPHCRYVEFAGGSHWLPREAPGPAAKRLISFVSGRLAAEGREEVLLG